MKIRVLMASAVMAILLLLTEIVLAGNGDLIVNGNLGVGIDAPAAKAEIGGDMIINGNTTTSGSAVVGGNLGIGTVTPQANLDVNGTANIANWAKQSLGPNGFVVVGSLIMQWGTRGAGSGEGAFDVTFPVEFNEIFNMQCTVINRDANLGKDTFCQVLKAKPARATLAINWTGGGWNWADDVYWFAIGR